MKGSFRRALDAVSFRLGVDRHTCVAPEGTAFEEPPEVYFGASLVWACPLGEVAEWCEESLPGRWRFVVNAPRSHFAFRSREDLILFRLRWAAG